MTAFFREQVLAGSGDSGHDQPHHEGDGAAHQVDPPEGDWLRRGRNLVRGHSPAALTVNAGKRSLVLDLKQAEARAVAQQLAARCDVLVESFRPGVVERLGLGASALRARAPDLVHVSISGFGRGGALAQRAVVDHVAQAYSGWMSVNADADGVPQRTRNVVLADQVTLDSILFRYVYEALVDAFGSTCRLSCESESCSSCA